MSGLIAPWRRIAAAFALAWAFVLATSGAEGSPEPASSAVAISLEQRDQGVWRLTYDNLPASRRIDLGAEADAARLGDWKVLTPGVRLVSDRGRAYLARAAGARGAWSAQLDIPPGRNVSPTAYDTQTRLGEQGVVLYTGHFIPFASEDARMDAALTVKPLPGFEAGAFGAMAGELNAWRSPYRHPAFIYVGPGRFRSGVAHALIDPAVPAWAAEETQQLLMRLLDWFEAALGEKLDRRPDMFLAMGEATGAGRLSYSGDALPAQFLITLSGGGWASPEGGARALLQAAIAHEVAHLWIMKLRPAHAGVADWIHEGGAEALAAEALAGLGLATPADNERALRAVRAECARLLDGRALRAARGRAAYPCGHAFIAAAARAHNREGAVARFWRDFAARAMRAGGYDEALFIAAIEAAAGAEVARAFSAFSYMAYASPERELDRLHTLAARSSSGSSLEPRSGR